MGQLRKLIFFASSHPGVNPDPIWRAYHFAHYAHEEGLDTEVRLAGDAVRIAHDDVRHSVGGPHEGALPRMIKERARAGLLVSL